MITKAFVKCYHNANYSSFRLLSFSRFSAASCNYTHVLVDRVGAEKNVGLVTMNKPKVNTLSRQMISDLNNAFDEFEADQKIGAIVLTGGPKIFTGGANIEEMASYAPDMLMNPHVKNFLSEWDRLAERRLPVIAAINGFCAGGGMEFSMAFDIIYAGKSAVFSQPEIKIGVFPGFGGSQRLIRQVGKSTAMEMILTGGFYSAASMERFGWLSRVCEDDKTISEAIKCAEKIASLSQLAVSYAKQAINKANELPLSQGIEYERRLFYSLFGSHDKQEGMKAFLEKRVPKWKHC